ncbi:MAG: hypothetical protein Q4F66_01110 [Clostridium sp.]|nr:hypothetical protein [Clostridium sp.]
MENDLISIQCDEVTKNMMSELQEDMIGSLSKVSKSMTQEVMEKLKPIEKKLYDLKSDFEDFVDDNEEFTEKIDSVNESLSNISKSIEVIIESSIIKVMNEQSRMMLEHNKVFNDNLHKVLDNTVQIQDSIFTSKEEIIEQVKKVDNSEVKNSLNSLEEKLEDKIDNISFEPLEDKLAILGLKLVKESSGNKEEILEKLEERNNDEILDVMKDLGQKVDSNFFSNKELLLEKVDGLKDKIDEKEVLIKIIHGFEKEFASKIDSIKEEVEWGNKSIFSRMFGKKKRKIDKHRNDDEEF